MDHLRLLGFIRELQGKTSSAFEVNRATRHIWNVHPGIVVMPETLCPFCSTVLRSNGIWLFSGPTRYMNLDGMVPLESGKLRIVYPSHPNMTSGGGRGGLCLGTYQTGMALLAGPANLNDCPMGVQNLPAWYRTYWGHRPCKEGYQWFLQKDYQVGSNLIGAVSNQYEHLTAADKVRIP